jgi:hypothetical protein
MIEIDKKLLPLVGWECLIQIGGGRVFINVILTPEVPF